MLPIIQSLTELSKKVCYKQVVPYLFLASFSEM